MATLRDIRRRIRSVQSTQKITRAMKLVAAAKLRRAQERILAARPYAGIRPAVNVGLSVSRVGGSAQIKAMRQVAGKLRLDLAQYRELAAFAQFGSDLDRATQMQLARGQRMVELLKQGQYQPLSVDKQVAIIFAGTLGLLDDVPVEAVRAFEEFFHGWLERRHPEVLREIRDKKEISPALNDTLVKAVQDAKGEFLAAKGIKAA